MVSAHAQFFRIASLRAPQNIEKLGFRPSKIAPGRFKIPSCWHYVGSFFALGRLFLALGRLVRVCTAFFTHVRLFFRVLGRSGSDFRASGGNLEGPKLFFRCFVVRAGPRCKKFAHVRKPQFFLCFCMVFTYCELCLQATKQRKSFPEPVQQSFLQRLCSNRVLGWILEGFGALWGVT